ncbi:MAG: trypsin-like peptidase domain-containing protein [Solirubrobacteraceae bacterium]|nr:trypsin-like peptidase domain-containing protein [Solirubrobacteraceae bacterium]
MSAGRSKSLWGQDNDRDGGYGWLEPEPAPRVQQAPPTPPPAPPKKNRSGLKIVGTTLAVAAIAVGGVAGVDHFANQPDNVTATVTLPVVNGSTPATRAGEIYKQVQSGVVQIRTGNASGTGFVVAQNGTIVTNAHVVDGASSVRVIFDDGDASVEGTVLGRDVSADLAVVKIDPDSVKKLTVLGLADSDDVTTGQEVLAVGYPLGLDRTATSGIVSGIGRQIKAQNGFSIDKVIQTDASINPGNSGGPLLDGRGRVIGVNSQIAATGSGSNTGIGFAIPSNTVRDVIPSLISGKTIARPYLGVSLQATDDDSGALVYETTPNGPGDKAGLRSGGPGTGDVVTAIDGESVADPDKLIEKLDEKKPNDKVTLTVKRDGQETKVDVILGERPANLDSASSGSQSPDSQQTP